MTPDLYCQEKATPSGSSLYYSFLFLSPEQRRAMTALYAFCRELEEVIIECSDVHVARTTLQWWRNQIAELYSGKAQHPVMQALLPFIESFNLSQSLFLEIIDGNEMDLEHSRYVDFKTLQLYCYRISSVVILLSIEILGYSDRNTRKFAHDLGIALQLSKIIRQVGQNARHNHIYLPVEELERFNVPAADVLHARDSEAFQQLIAFQIQRAKQYDQQALTHLSTNDRKKQIANLIMAEIERTTLKETALNGNRVLQEMVSLTPLRKLWIAYQTKFRNR